MARTPKIEPTQLLPCWNGECRPGKTFCNHAKINIILPNRNRTTPCRSYPSHTILFDRNPPDTDILCSKNTYKILNNTRTTKRLFPGRNKMPHTQVMIHQRFVSISRSHSGELRWRSFGWRNSKTPPLLRMAGKSPRQLWCARGFS